MKSTRNSLQDQLMELSLDIEDKDKTCRLLQRKISQETKSLAMMEETLANEFRLNMEKESAQHKAKTGELVALSNELVGEKTALLAACKALVEAAGEEDQAAAAQARALHRDGDKAMDRERRLFRAGYEDRLQKYLALRKQEIKESTEKGMQSEFTRLQSMHEREMAEVEQWLQAEERQLQQTMAERLQRSVDDERAAAKEELRLSLKAIQDKVGAECEQAVREAARGARSLQESQDRELDKCRALLGDKLKRLQASHRAELKQTAEASQQRIADLKASHALHGENVQTDHEQQVRQFKKQARESLAALEAGRAPLAPGDEPSEEPARNRVSPRKAPRSPSKVGSPAKRSGGDNDVDSRARREAEAQRDKLLQGEIRALEAESFRLERGWRARAEEEKARVQQAQVREEAEYARRVRGLNEQLADLVLSREQLLRAVQDLRQREAAGAQSCADARREVQVFREGVAAQRLRVKESEAQHKLRLREEQLQSGPRVRRLRERVEMLAGELRGAQRQAQDELESSEQRNAAELAEMDRQVTQDVLRLDQEVRGVREALAAEASRRAGLEDLVDKYSTPRSVPAREPADRRSATARPPPSADRSTFSSNRSATSTLSAGVGRSSSRYSATHK